METSSVRKFARACVCAFLSIALICGLMPGFSLVGRAYADEGADEIADSASARSDSIIIVYDDEALSLDEPLEAYDELEADDELELDEEFEADGDLELDEDFSSEEADPETLADLGVIDQDELGTAICDYGTVVVAQLSDETSVDEALEALDGVEGVAYAQPNYSYSVLATTSDPYCVTSEDSSENQQYLFDSTIVDAWDYAQSSGSVTVAVLDTGCNLEHSDLVDTVDAAHAYDVTSDMTLAESGVANNGDADGHGTLVAGVIAAEANNDEGIAGASYNANILPIKVFDDNGGCTSADLIAAYAYLDGLINSGEVSNLHVINISLGYYANGEDEADNALEEAIGNMLSNHDVLTVCAGGNGTSSGNASMATLYPSDFEECLSVTALDEAGANASFADYNAAKDISAPGVNILSTSSNGGYATATGTSMSAPLVAGAAALLWAADPYLSSYEVIAALEGTATEVTENAHAESGSAGALDAQAAVASVLGETVDDEASVNAEATEEEDAADIADNGEEIVVEDTDEAEVSDEVVVDDESNTSADGEENFSADATETEEFVQEVVGDDDTFASADEGTDNMVAVVTENGETIWLPADDPELAPDADENAVLGSNALSAGLSSSDITTLATTQYTWTKSGSSYYTTSGGTKCTVSGANSFGVDVSHWDGTIDWAKAKKAGVEFAIIQCGYGMDQTDQDDAQFLNNVKGCLDNGIPFGVTIYSYADSTSRASSEADHVIRLLNQIKSKYGVTASSLAYPVYFDLEETSLESTSKRTLLANMATTFCDKITAAGYTVGIYANKNWFDNYLTNSCFNNWTRWVADWYYPTTSSSISCKYTGSYDIWQFMDRGSVNGIGTDVDLNFCYSSDFVITPTKVTGLSTSMSATSAVTAAWNKVSGASGYQVGYRYTTGSNTSWNYTTTTSTSKKISGFSSNKQIAVKVRAYKSTGSTTKYGSWSSTLYRYTGQTSGLSSTMTYSKKKLKLTWSKYKASSGTVTYRVQYRKVGSSSWTSKDTTSTSYTLTGLTQGKAYQIRVYPMVKVSGNSGSGVCQTIYRYFGKTSGLNTSYNSSTKKLTIGWNKMSVSSGSVKYRVYYRKSGTSSWSTLDTTNRSCTISVTAGKAYQIRVRPIAIIDSKQYTATYGSMNRIMSYANPTVSRTGSNMTVKMSSVSSASGYQISYSRSSTFASSMSGTKKGKSRTIKLTGLRSSTAKYYVKSRAYRVISGTTYYTPYSTVKKC